MLILLKGDVDKSDEIETRKEIAQLAKYPISIITVGVGEGSFTDVEKLQDYRLNQYFRKMFQFV